MIFVCRSTRKVLGHGVAESFVDENENPSTMRHTGIKAHGYGVEGSEFWAM